MFKIISLIRSYKTISIILGIIALLSGTFLGLNSLKNGYIERGYNQAKSEYNELLIKEINKNTLEYETQLISLRDAIFKQRIKDSKRITTENAIDTKVEQVTEYITREVYVKTECNTVAPDVVRLFNESISRANNSKKDKS